MNTIVSLWTDPAILQAADEAAVVARISRTAVLRAALTHGLRELAGRPDELRRLAGRSQRHRSTP